MGEAVLSPAGLPSSHLTPTPTLNSQFLTHTHTFGTRRTRYCPLDSRPALDRGDKCALTGQWPHTRAHGHLRTAGLQKGWAEKYLYLSNPCWTRVLAAPSRKEEEKAAFHLREPGSWLPTPYNHSWPGQSPGLWDSGSGRGSRGSPVSGPEKARLWAPLPPGRTHLRAFRGGGDPCSRSTSKDPEKAFAAAPRMGQWTRGVSFLWRPRKKADQPALPPPAALTSTANYNY